VKFLLDSCVSTFALNELRKAGFEAIWVPEIGRDPGDEALLKKAFDEGLVLVTADKDFGELVYARGMPHAAIIRIVDIPAKEQGKVLMQLVERHRVDMENKSIMTVSRHRIRIRPSLSMAKTTRKKL